MQLLTIVTLIFVVILVLALTASLITIFALLWQIGGKLAKVQTALGKVRQETALLGAPFENLVGAIAETTKNLQAARKNISKSEGHMQAVAGQHESAGMAR